MVMIIYPLVMQEILISLGNDDFTAEFWVYPGMQPDNLHIFRIWWRKSAQRRISFSYMSTT